MKTKKSSNPFAARFAWVLAAFITFNLPALAQKKSADAESLLLSGYEGMKQREDRIPSPPNRV